MRILAVSNLFPPEILGGYEMICERVCDVLSARGHDLCVLTAPCPQSPSKRQPYQVCRILCRHEHRPYPLMLDAVRRRRPADLSDYHNAAVLLDQIESFKPDLVFFWNLHGLGGLHLIDVANICGVPWAMYLADRVLEQCLNSGPPAITAMFGATSAAWVMGGTLMSVSDHLSREIERMVDLHFPAYPEVVGAYVDPPFKGQHAPYRREGITRFAFAGSLSREKGVDIVLQASALVKAGAAEFRVDIFGGGDVVSYRTRALELGLAGIVEFHGAHPQAHLLEVYAETDAFLFPTWLREPSAFAPLEAASRGCVPVISAGCGCAERLIDGVNAIKVRRDARELSIAMLKVARGEYDLRAMGQAGIDFVRSEMTLDQHVDHVEQLLAGCAAGSRRSDVDFGQMRRLAYIKSILAAELQAH